MGISRILIRDRAAWHARSSAIFYEINDNGREIQRNESKFQFDLTL